MHAYFFLFLAHNLDPPTARTRALKLIQQSVRVRAPGAMHSRLDYSQFRHPINLSHWEISSSSDTTAKALQAVLVTFPYAWHFFY